MVYHGLFLSRVRYGIVAWGSTSEQNMTRVLILQKRAVRLIAGLGWRQTCREAFKELQLLTVPSLYIMETVMYCLEYGDFPTMYDVTGRSTRRAADLCLSPKRLIKSEQHVFRQGRVLFNALPQELKAERPNLRKFRRLLRQFLVEGVFYTKKEFFGSHVGP